MLPRTGSGGIKTALDFDRRKRMVRSGIGLADCANLAAIT
jgi:hypothetical protein